MLADLFPCCRDGAEADKSRQAFASLDDETDDTSSSESSRYIRSQCVGSSLLFDSYSFVAASDCMCFAPAIEFGPRDG